MKLHRTKVNSTSISRAIATIIVVIVVLVAAVGAYALVNTHSTTSSTTSTGPTLITTTSQSSVLNSSFSSSSSILTSQSSTPTTSVTNSSSGTVSTLQIEAWSWPAYDFNELYDDFYGPFPNYAMYSVYQPLVTINESAEMGQGNVQFLPGLAENWTVSSDVRTFTFNLRHASFSNGDPFNAYQVWMQMYGFYYLAGNYSNWLESYNVLNYSNVVFGPATIALINQSGVLNPSQQAINIMSNTSWPIYVSGPYTIVFHLQAPFTDLPATLTSYPGLIWDTQYVLKHGGFGSPTGVNSFFNLNPIPGTGPYVFSNIVENEYVQFTQNPTYWGKNLTAQQIAMQPFFDPGHVKNVVFVDKPDSLSRYTDLAAGRAQIADIGTDDWNLVTQNKNLNYTVFPPWSGLSFFMGLNLHLYPTNITDVRLAIAHAINTTDISYKALLGATYPFVGPTYPLFKEFYDLGNFTPYQYNLTLAKQYLAKANVSNMPDFTMNIISGCPACDAEAQVVQADLAQIGINVVVTVETGSTFYSNIGSYSYNIQHAQQLGQLPTEGGGGAWGPFALSPADEWAAFLSNNSAFGNIVGYSNPVVQACIDGFTTISNTTQLKSLCTAAQKQVYDDVPYIWFGLGKYSMVSGGSTVYNKNVIRGYMVDPTWGGQDQEPIINTVTFVNGQ